MIARLPQQQKVSCKILLFFVNIYIIFIPSQIFYAFFDCRLKNTVNNLSFVHKNNKRGGYKAFFRLKIQKFLDKGVL